ncbi:hypothetical protein [Microbacterium sp. NPDC089696]|uniref:hypothetical protein n=1 Tax=Microbacterium sp. NPDC089696 TaxID=3364199 RepID=UPI00381207F0
MRVVIDIPDRDYGRLVNVAEGMGVKVPELIFAATLELMPWRETTADRVEHLVRAGLSDARIAQRLDVPNWKVAQYRRDAGLAANNQGRGGGGKKVA